MIKGIEKLPPVTLVAAVTRDGGLGRAGELLYRISADMKHFKALTMGHPLIMGRKTFESFPSGPLPGRLNIVLTRSAMTLPEGAVAAGSPDEALRFAAEYIADKTASCDSADCGAEMSAMVIGGGEIYRTFMPMASVLELTEIDADAPAGTDTWFPPVNPADWNTVAASAPFADQRTAVAYRFLTLRHR
ncbi:dihydrofolate reductase [uncultured Muribaculum sp.]|uniref:dihydrofolate reductase n=1 Tax=uncultured Muribaculum sp. TaxID=1918613 RepID=UPI0025CFE652|nr:dihydrofolate reductase [uncultured Muribaculum sp.]